MKKIADGGIIDSYIREVVISDCSATTGHVHVPSEHLSQFGSLDSSQLEAAQISLQEKVSLIKGPPGCGKTSTICQIVKMMKVETCSHVLCCAPSNTATDHLAEALHKTGLKVMQVQS